MSTTSLTSSTGSFEILPGTHFEFELESTELGNLKDDLVQRLSEVTGIPERYVMDCVQITTDINIDYDMIEERSMSGSVLVSYQSEARYTATVMGGLRVTKIL